MELKIAFFFIYTIYFVSFTTTSKYHLVIFIKEIKIVHALRSTSIEPLIPI